MISVKHLTKCYGEFTAVDDLSFEIDEGHVYGFLGPNGAGKSTTMNIITGCLSATSGQVTIDGHDIFEEPKDFKVIYIDSKLIVERFSIPFLDTTVEAGYFNALVDAVKYLKTLRRMCNRECSECEFGKKLGVLDTCALWQKANPEEVGFRGSYGLL